MLQKLKNPFYIQKRRWTTFNKIWKKRFIIRKTKKIFKFKNIFYEIESKQKIKKSLTILNTNERKYSTKTDLTNSPIDINNYNLCLLNKYEENVNDNFSLISEFGTEEDKSKLNDSFSSSGSDE